MRCFHPNVNNEHISWIKTFSSYLLTFSRSFNKQPSILFISLSILDACCERVLSTWRHETHRQSGILHLSIFESTTLLDHSCSCFRSNHIVDLVFWRWKSTATWAQEETSRESQTPVLLPKASRTSQKMRYNDCIRSSFDRCQLWKAQGNRRATDCLSKSAGWSKISNGNG